jgi:hypothetical protein
VQHVVVRLLGSFTEILLTCIMDTAPQMSGGEAEGVVVTAGRQLADGGGVLADGTRWEKKSGIEYGKVGAGGGVGGLGTGGREGEVCVAV